MTGKQIKEAKKLIRALCLVAVVNGKEVKATKKLKQKDRI